MAIYTPITNVMPLASMVTGAPVSAALGDQLRDNLVALYDGWWFRATRSTATGALTTSVVISVPMDTVTMSRSATDDGTITIVAGYVTLRKPGIWRLGFHYSFTSPFTGIAEALIDANDAAGAYVAERLTDPNQTATDLSVSGVQNVTTVPTTVTPAVYVVGTPNIGVTRPPVVWGLWLGDNP